MTNQYKQYKEFIEQRKAELILKGILPQVAAKRALKAARRLHPAHKQATARKLAHADDRFALTGKTDSYNAI